MVGQRASEADVAASAGSGDEDVDSVSCTAPADDLSADDAETVVLWVKVLVVTTRTTWLALTAVTSTIAADSNVGGSFIMDGELYGGFTKSGRLDVPQEGNRDVKIISFFFSRNRSVCRADA
jgi:hypothetical protein